LLLVVVNFAATQYVAARFQHQPALGSPLTRTKTGVAIYQPFAWIIWGWHNSTSQDPQVRKPLFEGEMIVFAGSLACVGVFFGAASRRSRRLMRNADDLHGSARWATKDDIRTTGLMDGQHGVYVGAWCAENSNRLQYLRHNGPEHILAFAPTRSGKGVGLVRRVWRRVLARCFEKTDYVFAAVNVGPAAAPDHFLDHHPVAFGRRHRLPAPIEFFGDCSADVDALHSNACGTGACDVFPDQFVQRLPVCTLSLLQEPVEVNETILLPISKTKRAHAFDMLADDRTQVTAIARQRTKRFHGVLWLRACQSTQYGRRRTAFIRAPQFRYWVARYSSSFNQPVEEPADNAAIMNGEGKRQCLQFFFQPCPEHRLSTLPLKSTAGHKALEPLQQRSIRAMAPGEAEQFELVHKLGSQCSVFIGPAGHDFPFTGKSILTARRSSVARRR
jgi:hypothetical protein